MRSHTVLYVNIYSGFTHNCSKLETTQMSFDQRMGEQTVEHPYDGLVLHAIDTGDNMDES